MFVKIMVPVRVILGLYWGYMGDNGKEDGNYYIGVIYIYIHPSSPSLGTLNIRCRIIIGYPKRDHNFDNQPCMDMWGHKGGKIGIL